MSVQATDAKPAPEADQLLEGLNPQQRQAVVHEGAPLLIVAVMALALFVVNSAVVPVISIRAIKEGEATRGRVMDKLIPGGTSHFPL